MHRPSTFTLPKQKPEQWHCKEIQFTFTNDIYLIQQAQLFHWSISKSKDNGRLKRLGNIVFIISEKGLCGILLCFTFQRTKPSEIHKWKRVARKSSLFARLKYSLRAEISSATFQSWTRFGALIYKPWGTKCWEILDYSIALWIGKPLYNAQWKGETPACSLVSHLEQGHAHGDPNLVQSHSHRTAPSRGG